MEVIHFNYIHSSSEESGSFGITFAWMLFEWFEEVLGSLLPVSFFLGLIGNGALEFTDLDISGRRVNSGSSTSFAFPLLIS